MGQTVLTYTAEPCFYISVIYIFSPSTTFFSGPFTFLKFIMYCKPLPALYIFPQLAPFLLSPFKSVKEGDKMGLYKPPIHSTSDNK
jgi:hypothetical protein